MDNEFKRGAYYSDPCVLLPPASIIYTNLIHIAFQRNIYATHRLLLLPFDIKYFILHVLHPRGSFAGVRGN